MQCHNKKLNTLGYKIEALNKEFPAPKSVDPTFFPSFNEFQTYEWRDMRFNGETTPNGPNNCFLYLQMTKGHDAPSDLHYNYTGNLVNNSDSGTLLVSRKLFWDEWLLPKLTTLNYNTYLEATHAHCSNNEIFPDWEFGWLIGSDSASHNNRKDDQDPFYAWNKKQDGFVWGGNPFSRNNNWVPRSHGFTFDRGETNQRDTGGMLASKLECEINCKPASYSPILRIN